MMVRLKKPHKKNPGTRGPGLKPLAWYTQQERSDLLFLKIRNHKSFSMDNLK